VLELHGLSVGFVSGIFVDTVHADALEISDPHGEMASAKKAVVTAFALKAATVRSHVSFQLRCGAVWWRRWYALGPAVGGGSADADTFSSQQPDFRGVDVLFTNQWPRGIEAGLPTDSSPAVTLGWFISYGPVVDDNTSVFPQEQAGSGLVAVASAMLRPRRAPYLLFIK
jgi:hypothetical protein